MYDYHLELAHTVTFPSAALYIHMGENRHGNLGTYGGDGNGDNPLLQLSLSVSEFPAKR